MKSLSKYITESYEEEYLKLSKEDRQRLLDLDLEYGKLMLIARYETVVREISNKDQEWKKFYDLYITKRIKYFPVMEYKPLKWKEYNLAQRAKDMISEFERLNCYLSKYYIQNLKGIISKIDYLKTLDDINYQPDTTQRLNQFDPKLVEEAEMILREQPYRKAKGKKYDRNLTGEDAAKRIKDVLDDFGYDWKVIMKPDMLPRMGVNPEKTFRIKPSAKFSEIDIKSLVAHEIRAHVAKRYHGYETGLFLFVFGLDGKNIFDEGLAIWNTFNTIDETKPNPFFKIAIAYLTCYYCLQMDFCDAFEKLKELTKDSEYSDKAIFSQLMRCKRSVIKTERLGCWSGDMDYFRGFKLVDKMNSEEREIILKYNIGPEQFFEVPTIKKFLSFNRFSPISNAKLAEIKEEYKDLENK